MSAATSTLAGSLHPPTILVGAGAGNALSIARSLGRTGVDVYLLTFRGAPTTYSRYARRIALPDGDEGQEGWARFLLGPESDYLRGGVLLACNDDALELLIQRRRELKEKYVLDSSDPAAQLRMLNKLSTYRCAAECGVPTPLFWDVADLAAVHAHRQEYVYPLILKPLYQQKYKRVHADKYVMAHDFEGLVSAYERLQGEGLEVVLMEEIPGPDDRLCSYFTYIDEAGEPLFHLTKRIIRRYPKHQGFGCHHITDWNPEVRDLGLRLVTHAGLRGLANVEFKRDVRDGQLKLIECNARFVAPNVLIARSGYDLGLLVYNRLADRPQAPLLDRPYARGMRLVHPLEDFLSFLELRADGELDAATWLRSLLHHQTLPYFWWSDPLPSAVGLSRELRTLTAVTVRRVMARRRGTGGTGG